LSGGVRVEGGRAGGGESRRDGRAREQQELYVFRAPLGKREGARLRRAPVTGTPARPGRSTLR